MHVDDDSHFPLAVDSPTVAALASARLRSPRWILLSWPSLLSLFLVIYGLLDPIVYVVVLSSIRAPLLFCGPSFLISCHGSCRDRQCWRTPRASSEIGGAALGTHKESLKQRELTVAGRAAGRTAIGRSHSKAQHNATTRGGIDSGGMD